MLLYDSVITLILRLIKDELVYKLWQRTTGVSNMIELSTRVPTTRTNATNYQEANPLLP